MSWARVPFGELYAEPLRNGLARPKRARGSGFKMVNMGELFAHDRIRNPSMDLVPLSDTEIQKFGLADGDLLFARQSFMESGAGKCSIMLYVPEVTCFESHIIRVRLDQRRSVPLFYYYYFRSALGRAAIEAIVTGTAQKGIRGSELAEILVHHPPKAEQQRIAEVLSAYDDLIENNERRAALLEEAIHLLHREWFVHLRFPSRDRVAWVGGVPEGWTWATLGEWVTLNHGKPLPQRLREAGPFPVYGSSGVVGSNNEALVQGPGLILGRKGNVGAVFLSDSDFFPIDTVYYVDHEQTSLFLYACLASMTFVSSDAAVPGLNRSHIYKQRILIPPQALRDEYERYASCYWRQRRKLLAQNVRLCEARDLLLPRLMNGSIAG